MTEWKHYLRQSYELVKAAPKVGNSLVYPECINLKGCQVEPAFVGCILGLSKPGLFN